MKIGRSPYVFRLHDHDKLLAHRNSASDLGTALGCDPVDWRKNVAVAQIQERRVQLRFGDRGIRCARFVVGLSDDYLTGSIQRVLLKFTLLLAQLRAPRIHHLLRGCCGERRLASTAACCDPALARYWS